jgi:cyclic-di-GMP-binding protein
MLEPYKKADFERAVNITSLKDTSDRQALLAMVRELAKEVVEMAAELAVIELERLEALIKLDEKFHLLLARDQLDFLRAMLVLDTDMAFGRDVQLISLELARALQRYVRNRTAWNTTRQTENQLIRAIGLAVHNVHTLVKWNYFLHEESAVPPWKQLHALYTLAETEGFALVPFVLRPQVANHRFTVQALFLRALMLSTLNSGNLSKSHIEIADGWYGAWCRDYRLEKTFNPEHHLFYVDLSKESGVRILMEKVGGENIRFVRADSLKGQIEEVQTGLRHGRLYSGYGYGASFPVAEHVTVLSAIEKLYGSIIAGSDNRIEARRRLEDREVDVVVSMESFVALHRALLPPAKGQASLALVDMTGNMQTLESREPQIETWKMQDLSTKGYGLVIERDIAERVPLNCIIALKNQRRGTWVVGNVVRKLPKKERGILIGIEVLNYHPIPVRLMAQKGGTTMHGKADRQRNVLEGFYMAGVDRKGKQDALLLRGDDFTSAYPYELESGGTRYMIRLNRIIKKGNDWLVARFEIESKRAA